MDVVARGSRRFEIAALNEERDFLQAQVNFFDDDDFAAVPAELREPGALPLPRARRHLHPAERTRRI